MGTISIDLPDGMHRWLMEIATREGVSIDYFVTTAVAHKVSALTADDDIAERAPRGSRAKYEAALAQAPDADPDEHDPL